MYEHPATGVGPFARTGPIGYLKTDRNTRLFRRPTYRGPEGYHENAAEPGTSMHPFRYCLNCKSFRDAPEDRSACLYLSLFPLETEGGPRHWLNIG